jgi:hypothetical protein
LTIGYGYGYLILVVGYGYVAMVIDYMDRVRFGLSGFGVRTSFM